MLGTEVLHPRERRPGEREGRARGLGISDRVVRRWSLLPLASKMLIVVAVGAAEAAVVGYVTAKNPAAAPAHIAVILRVVIILGFIGAGVYAQTHHIQVRMGVLLIAVGLYSGFWLLNGSSNPYLFSIGALCAGLTPAIYASVVLAHPDGHLHSRAERRLAWGVGGALTILWVVAYLLTRQPPIKTPLLLCTPHCPDNVFSVGSATRVGQPWIALIVVTWLALAWGPPVMLYRRARSASLAARRSLTPVWMVATVSAVLLALDLLLRAADLRLASAFSAAYLEMSAAVLALTILAGLGRERLFIGGALADFVSEIGRVPAEDPQTLMAAAMHDPSLTIAYRRPGVGTYVDSHGKPVSELPQGQATTWIESHGLPVAAVSYDPELADQERFLQAAGTAALMQLEKAQLEADLRASLTDLEASRVRLMESANLERRRLERDLHDGVQQDLTALRIRLDMASEKLRDDPVAGQRMLASIGKQMDKMLQELRLLARGIYPSVLHERGLVDALKSVAFNLPVHIVVRGIEVGRYPEEVEVAVYFCCLEAMQNIVKHAGPDAHATVHLWQEGPRVYFEVRDSGRGFEPEMAAGGSGLANMRDRIQAVGGTLTITSSPGRRTTVRGAVPVG